MARTVRAVPEGLTPVGKRFSFSPRLLGNISGQAVRVLVGPVVALGFGPVGRGLLALVELGQELGSRFISVGYPDAVTAEVMGHMGGNSARSLQVPLHIRHLFRLGGVGVAFGGITYWIAMRSESGAPYAMEIALVIGLSPLLFGTVAAVALGRVALGKDTSVIIWRIVPALGMAGAAGLALILDSFSVVLWGTIVGQTCALAYYASRRYFRIAGEAAPRGFFKAGLANAVGSLAQLVNNRVDQLAVAAVLTVAQAGIYAVAASTMFFLLPIAVSHGQGCLARVAESRMVRQSKGASASATLDEVILETLVLAGVITLATGPIGIGVIRLLYGSEFGQSVGLMFILLLGGIPHFAFSALRASSIAVGEPMIASRAQAGAMVVTAVAIVPSLALAGLAGAALLSVVAYWLRLWLVIKGLRPNWATLRTGSAWRAAVMRLRHSV